MTKTLPLYGGALKANVLGSFVRGGETFHVIRPGYCIQGKRRTNWTQIVHEDIPVFESKMGMDLQGVTAKFRELWTNNIGDDPELLKRALAATKQERRRKFRDGRSGEAIAPATTRSKRDKGVKYTG